MIGILKEIVIIYVEVVYVFDKMILKIEEVIFSVFEQILLELFVDIYKMGIYFVGGGFMF